MIQIGIFIALEGIDGCGKTTTLTPLIEKLNENSISSKLINKKKIDYTDSRIKKYASTIKDLIWYSDDDPHYFVTEQGWLYFHALWYSILVENEIIPNLDKYDILIVDGWFYKMYSRFLLKESFNTELLASVFNSVRNCEHVFMLDTLPENCWKRRGDFNYTEVGGYDNVVNNPKDSYISYQSKVRDKLLKISKKEKWTVIDSNKLTINETVDKIINEIKFLRDL